MKIAITAEELASLVNRQISNFWGGDLSVQPYIEKALNRLSICFSKSKNKYYKNKEGCYFSPYHSGQYSIFIYYLSNTVFITDNNTELASNLLFE